MNYDGAVVFDKGAPCEDCRKLFSFDSLSSVGRCLDCMTKRWLNGVAIRYSKSSEHAREHT